MRIAIFGTGGAGGYFGAQLARSGEDVTFIARGEHLEAIRTRGLRVETPKGEIVIHPARATDDAAKVGRVDVVLVGVKTWQLSDAAQGMLPLMGSETLAVPLQNGVEAAAQLGKVLGEDRVLCGLCGTISRLVGPGRILSLGETNFIKFGEEDNSRTPRALRLLETFQRANVRAEVPADIHVALWEKFIFVAPYGGVGALTRSDAGVIRTLPETRRMIERGMQEILDVARARRISLTGDIIEKTMKLLDGLDPDSTTSLQRDIVAGKPSELEAWNGAVVRLGREARVETPLNEFIYHSLLPQEMSAHHK